MGHSHSVAARRASDVPRMPLKPYSAWSFVRGEPLCRPRLCCNVDSGPPSGVANANVTNLCNDEIYLLSPNTVGLFGRQGVDRPLDRLDLSGRLGNGNTLWLNFEENLQAVLATLEECQAALVRQRRPRHGATGFGRYSRASDQAQSDRRFGIEGFVRCNVAGRRSGLESRVHPKPQEGLRQRSPVSLKLVK